MKKIPNNKAQRMVNGELERVVEMSVTLGIIPRLTEKEKTELVNGMYAIINDYSLLNCDDFKKAEDYNKFKEGC